MDKTLTCRECGSEFLFTESEQAFYAEKGFENLPARCPDCRAKNKARRNNRSREMYTVTCSECGVECQVPFKPSGDRPVFCRDCFSKKR